MGRLIRLGTASMQQVSRGMVGVLEKLGWHPVEIYTLVYTV